MEAGGGERLNWPLSSVLKESGEMRFCVGIAGIPAVTAGGYMYFVSNESVCFE